MKNRILIIIVLINFMFCYSQDKKKLYLDINQYKKNEILDIPKFAFENLSTDDFISKIYENRKKNFAIDSITNKYKIRKKNGIVRAVYSELSYNIKEVYSDETIKYDYKINQETTYSYGDNKLYGFNNEYNLEYKNDNYDFNTYTHVEYFKNKNLRFISSQAYLFGGFDAGKWQAFNKEGKLVKELNYNDYFKLTFINVFDLLKDFFYYLDEDDPKLERSFNGNEAYWICYFPDCYQKIIIINDKTGEFIYPKPGENINKYYFKEFEKKLIEDFMKEGYYKYYED